LIIGCNDYAFREHIDKIKFGKVKTKYHLKNRTKNLKRVFLSIDEHLENIIDKLFVWIEAAKNFNVIVKFRSILRSVGRLRGRLDHRTILLDFFGVGKLLAFRQQISYFSIVQVVKTTCKFILEISGLFFEFALFTIDTNFF
jgi:hypothetical protein